MPKIREPWPASVCGPLPLSNFKVFIGLLESPIWIVPLSVSPLTTMTVVKELRSKVPSRVTPSSVLVSLALLTTVNVLPAVLKTPW